jgi:MarR family transcriptional regulator, transcriptional regulator for hemolysin
MKVKKRLRWDPRSAPTFWINHASRLLMRHFEQRLRPLDLGMAYMPVAAALEESGPLSQKRLAELAHVEQPTMAALLGRMERDGIISRLPHPTDKRASQISLSVKGEASLPAAREQLFEVAEQALSGVTKQERLMLLELLRRVVSNLEQNGAE